MNEFTFRNQGHRNGAIQTLFVSEIKYCEDTHRFYL